MRRFFVHRFPIHRRAALLAAAATALLATGPVRALTINATFDNSIASDPNAAAIENTINNVVSYYDHEFTNNIAVNITFAENNTGGLGSNLTSYDTHTYQHFYNALGANANTAAAKTAFASLPNQTNNPVTNDATGISVTLPEGRVLGLDSAPGTTSDSTVTVNVSETNITTGVNNSPNNYDLFSVESHEIDEVLGLGSSLDNGAGGPVEPEDLFRYSAPGTRSYTTSTTATSYFSIDGGNTIIRHFNQDPTGGADHGDWASGNTAYVQDAFGSPGTAPRLSYPEITALNAIGYTPVPEPTTVVVIALGGLGLLTRRRGRKSA